jgi:hypothetical protein
MRVGSSAQNGRAASEPGVQRIPKRHFYLSTALATCLVLQYHLRLSCYITCIGLACITCLKTVKTIRAKTQIQEIR